MRDELSTFLRRYLRNVSNNGPLCTLEEHCLGRRTIFRRNTQERLGTNQSRVDPILSRLELLPVYSFSLPRKIHLPPLRKMFDVSFFLFSLFFHFLIDLANGDMKGATFLLIALLVRLYMDKG